MGKFIPWIFAVVDLITVNAVYLLLCAFHPAADTPTMWGLINLALVPVLWRGLRNKQKRALQLDAVARQALGDVALQALILLAMMGVLQINALSIGLLAQFYGMMLVAFIVARVGSRFLLKSYRRGGRGYVRVVIVGANSTGTRLAYEMQKDAGFGYKILGYFDDTCPAPDFDGKYIG
ncbi:MAG: hypothetical protein K2M12_10630, partial [Muribaculaceae bacterium]|nr:hypothetical protein [Muribaculaceae bacterium]